MNKDAYNIGALLACIDTGLVKEAGTVGDVARVLWKSTKERVGNIGREVREAASRLRRAERSSATPTVGKKFLEGYKGTVPTLKPHSAAPPIEIAELERSLLEKAQPWITGAGAGLGALGAGYGGYQGAKALWPRAFED